MAFTTIKTDQKTFLETYLRGTGKTLTAADANARFGIQKLAARKLIPGRFKMQMVTG